MSRPKVLVTGGTGFVASHCIDKLLGEGYNVSTTVRSSSKGDRLVDAFRQHLPNKLSYHIVENVANLNVFDEVVKSIPNLEYVLHTASPFHYNIQNPVKDFLEPAVNGSTGILKAIRAHAPSVKRVVLTSSTAAVNSVPKSLPPIYDETCWNPTTWDEAAEDTNKTYEGSKKLAEKAAWDFVDKHSPGFDLVVVNPALIFGPVAPHLAKGEVDSVNASNSLILRMIRGDMKDKLAPTGFFYWVDVRDVADAHLRAMTLPEASGKRFLLIAGPFTNPRLAQIIARLSPELESELPADIDSLVDDTPKGDERYGFRNEQSKQVLGVNYTSLEKSVKDTVVSLQALL